MMKCSYIMSALPLPSYRTPSATGVLLSWLVPSFDSGLVHFPSTLGYGGLITLVRFVVAGRVRPGWMVPVGSREEIQCTGEVCCTTPAQHTSTNCDPPCSTDCSNWLMLSKCWRSTALLYVWLLGGFLRLWCG